MELEPILHKVIDIGTERDTNQPFNLLNTMLLHANQLGMNGIKIAAIKTQASFLGHVNQIETWWFKAKGKGHEESGKKSDSKQK